MAETIRGTCKGFKDNGLRCGGNPKRGDEYCYWCMRKPERQRKLAEELAVVTDIAGARRARDGGTMTVEEYEDFLERIIAGAEKEKRQTSAGETYDAEACVRDKLAAGRELRQLRGWHGDDQQNAADRLGFTIADLVRDKLGG